MLAHLNICLNRFSPSQEKEICLVESRRGEGVTLYLKDNKRKTFNTWIIINNERIIPVWSKEFETYFAKAKDFSALNPNESGSLFLIKRSVNEYVLYAMDEKGNTYKTPFLFKRIIARNSLEFMKEFVGAEE